MATAKIAHLDEYLSEMVMAVHLLIARQMKSKMIMVSARNADHIQRNQSMALSVSIPVIKT
jgi:hypothetical protein